MQQLGPRYKWIALSNTTLGVLMAAINSSIVLIALPDLFRGILWGSETRCSTLTCAPRVLPGHG
jgi:hypothetical protein